jgi:hypothetical protein
VSRGERRSEGDQAAANIRARRIHRRVRLERDRQDEIWGREFPGRTWDRWLVILLEEVGEVARAINERDALDLEEELVQVAAVAMKALEFGGQFDRRPWPGIMQEELLAEAVRLTRGHPVEPVELLAAGLHSIQEELESEMARIMGRYQNGTLSWPPGGNAGEAGGEPSINPTRTEGDG